MSASLPWFDDAENHPNRSFSSPSLRPLRPLRFNCETDTSANHDRLAHATRQPEWLGRADTRSPRAGTPPMPPNEMHATSPCTPRFSWGPRLLEKTESQNIQEGISKDDVARLQVCHRALIPNPHLTHFDILRFPQPDRTGVGGTKNVLFQLLCVTMRANAPGCMMSSLRDLSGPEIPG